MEMEHATSAKIVASIDHLLARILLLLPIKSLLRFKSVSKDWLALISSPIFCHLYNPNPTVGLFLPSPQNHHHQQHFDFEYIPFSAHSSRTTFDFPSHVRILQSCNGILLCCSTVAPNYTYYVYNPTTNHRSEIPRSGILDDRCGMSLAFDPIKSSRFNVVCVRLFQVDSGNPHFLIEIYSSETGSWLPCGEPFPALVDFGNGVYWNGAIHWLGIGNGQSLYFDVENQVLDKMPTLPLRYGWNSRSHYYLGESCDHLHFIEMPGPIIRFDVYELQRDYSNWFVKYRVDLSQVVAANPDMVLGYINPIGWYSLVFSVLAIIRSEQEEDSFLVLQTLKKAIRYNLVSKTFENLYDFEGDVVKGSLRYPATCGFQYIESLCCV